ncbi:MAG: hypothetical protein U1F25_20055 [Rubrivivax sp.]
MSAAAWIALAVAAVLGFWMLGAYNRLVSLRNAVAAAWAQADEAQRRRAEGAQALVAVLRKPLDGEQGALDALWAAQNASARAAGAMSARPLATANAAAWAEAERKLGAAAARVFALAESHAPAAGVTAAMSLGAGEGDDDDAAATEACPRRVERRRRAAALAPALQRRRCRLRRGDRVVPHVAVAAAVRLSRRRPVVMRFCVRSHKNRSG